MKMVTSESQTLVPCSVSDFLSVPSTEALCPDHTYRPSCQRRGHFLLARREWILIVSLQSPTKWFRLCLQRGAQVENFKSCLNLQPLIPKPPVLLEYFFTVALPQRKMNTMLLQLTKITET